MKKLLVALTFWLAPALAHADLINGGFETGNFTGWQTIGDALVVDSSIGTAPAGGNYQALITNAPELGAALSKLFWNQFRISILFDCSWIYKSTRGIFRLAQLFSHRPCHRH